MIVTQSRSLIDVFGRVCFRLESSREDLQVRLLEERNHIYMQRTCELEEELRRANAIRSQLDTYKRQAHEMSAKHSAEAMKTLLKEREKLICERDTLRETTEELRCAQVQQQCLTDSGAVGSLAAEIMPAELRLSQQQISELSSQVEELQRALQEQDIKTEDSSLSKKKLEEHLEKLHEAHSDLQKKQEVIDDLEPHVDSNIYMYGLLEHDFKRTRSRHDQEEKLIISAWYNMGMALHQKVSGSGSGPAQSFLAQQRQWTQARRGLSRLQPR
uniref:Hook C-terminal domain-containing protein n=1 Tax=Sinocyclocheilus rhinocerous TaxID=307959 RepID=A0A673NB33_9TELE